MEVSDQTGLFGKKLVTNIFLWNLLEESGCYSAGRMMAVGGNSRSFIVLEMHTAKMFE